MRCKRRLDKELKVSLRIPISTSRIWCLDMLAWYLLGATIAGLLTQESKNNICGGTLLTCPPAETLDRLQALGASVSHGCRDDEPDGSLVGNDHTLHTLSTSPDCYCISWVPRHLAYSHTKAKTNTTGETHRPQPCPRRAPCVLRIISRSYYEEKMILSTKKHTHTKAKTNTTGETHRPQPCEAP